VRLAIGFDRVVLDEASKRQQALMADLEMQISDIESVDTIETMTKLMDETRALEASYRALVRVTSLSLTQFL
jgi:flagellin-like hook-associated protein FlgL